MGCQACGLHKFRRNQVKGRGMIPAQVLFIGEAPGRSEDLRGEAMIGPTKRIIDSSVIQAAKLAGILPPSIYITNVLQCRPTDCKGGPNRKPTGEEAWACFPLLEQVYLEVAPERVVFLGRVAEKYCKAAWPDGVHLFHPAYLLRTGGKEGPEYKRFCRDLAAVFFGLKLKKKGKENGKRKNVSALPH